MKNAKELMLEYTAFSFRDPKKAAEMFVEDGTFEMPYLATFGFPPQYKGRDAIAGFFQSVLDIRTFHPRCGLSADMRASTANPQPYLRATEDLQSERVQLSSAGARCKRT